MRILSLLISLLLLAGCIPYYASYANMDTAFRVGCDSKTIVASLNIDGETLILKATCTKEK